MRFLSSYSYSGNPTASLEIRGEELFYLSSDCRAATNRAALPAVQRVARNKVRGKECRIMVFACSGQCDSDIWSRVIACLSLLISGVSIVCSCLIARKEQKIALNARRAKSRAVVLALVRAFQQAVEEEKKQSADLLVQNVATSWFEKATRNEFQCLNATKANDFFSSPSLLFEIDCVLFLFKGRTIIETSKALRGQLSMCDCEYRKAKESGFPSETIFNQTTDSVHVLLSDIDSLEKAFDDEMRLSGWPMLH